MCLLPTLSMRIPKILMWLIPPVLMVFCVVDKNLNYFCQTFPLAAFTDVLDRAKR